MRHLFLLFGLFLTGCGSTPAALTRHGALEISAAWANPAPATGVGGVYFILANTGSTADRLVGATSELAPAAEIHTTTQTNQHAQLRPAFGLDLPANSRVQLAPGSHHVMLINLNTALRAGETYTLTLRFEQAGAVTVPFVVRQP